MRFSTAGRHRINQKVILCLVVVFFASFINLPSANAVVDISSSELQESAGIIFPGGSSLTNLSYYEEFNLETKGSADSGAYAIYEAKLSSNYYVYDELPQLKLSAYAYSSQASAEVAFASMSNYGSFYNGLKTVISSDSKNIFYQSAPGRGVDVFGTVTSEEYSLHLLHLNGSLLYHASFYRNGGEYNKTNVDAFLSLVDDQEEIKNLFDEGVEYMKMALSVLYLPTSSDFSAISEKSSFNLNELYSVPRNGNIDFDIYLSSPTSSAGTIFDSSGISDPADGDIYLYLASDAKLYAGIYAPDYDSNCNSESGWYKISSEEEINAYEWNTVSFHYGINGFWLSVNGDEASSCELSQSRSNKNLYFGDFPDDSIYESVGAYIDNLQMSYDYYSGSESWDEIFSNQLFVDLESDDEDYEVFEFLKDEGVFLGSGGYLNPDESLNRAEMVKILLKAYDYSSGTLDTPFLDVSSDEWYFKYLSKAYEIGMVKGNSDGNFSPAALINRAEFFTMLYRMSGQKKFYYRSEFADVSASDWYLTAAAFAINNNLLDEGVFLPSQVVTRREAAKAIYKMIK